jgi:hypothetical protein
MINTLKELPDIPNIWKLLDSTAKIFSKPSVMLETREVQEV